MELKYVQKITNKYNSNYINEFAHKKSEQKFLFPCGLTLKHFPSTEFDTNRKKLTPDEEFKLFSALHYMKYKITKSRTCYNRYLQIYTVLRNRCISANWTLVLSCTKKYLSKFTNGMDKAEFIENSYLALIYAVDGFDPWRGIKFSTYAYTAIIRCFYYQCKNYIPVISIDNINIKTTHEDKNHLLWLDRLKVVLQSNNLTFREKLILKYRFQDKLALKDIGIIFGLSKERIRQIQIIALSKLKENLIRDPILF